MPKLSARLEIFAAAYAAAAGLPKNPTPPITTPAPDFCRDQNANYANQTHKPKAMISHFPTSLERQTALNIITWTYCVAGIPADSPRFAYYVSRWNVPGKIARAIADGTFEQITANCPPIDPAWIRFVPAALDAHREFNAPRKPTPGKAKSSPQKPRADQLIFSIEA